MRPLKTLHRICPVCQSQVGEVLHHQDFVLFESHPLDEGYDVVHCDRCGFVFADINKTQVTLDQYYELLSKYEDNKVSTGAGTDSHDAARLKQACSAIIPYLPDKNARILDLGCANGGLLREFFEHGYDNLFGIDPSSVCISNTKKNVACITFQASLFHLPPNLGNYDCIVLSHVIEHIVDLHSAVEILEKLLAPEGILYIECPDASRYKNFVHAPFQEFNTEHINHFTMTSMGNLFVNSGLAVKKQKEIQFNNPSGQPYFSIFKILEKLIVPTKHNEFSPDKNILPDICEYIGKSSELLQRMEDRIKLVSKSYNCFIVWGTGQLLFKLLTMTILNNLNIKAFIDSNPINKGKKLNGVEVVTPEELQSVLTHEDCIMITTTIHEEFIRKSLMNQNVNESQIIGFQDIFISSESAT